MSPLLALLLPSVEVALTVNVGRPLTRYSPEPALPFHAAVCVPAASVPRSRERTSLSSSRTAMVTAARRVSRKPSVVWSRVPSPLGEIVTGTAVGKPRVRSTVTSIPCRAMLPASSRRSTSNR